MRSRSMREWPVKKSIWWPACNASASPGQTLAAQDLCTKVKPLLRTHHVQPGVGPYGVFSGRRWQRHIYPLVRNVIPTSQWR